MTDVSTAPLSERFDAFWGQASKALQSFVEYASNRRQLGIYPCMGFFDSEGLRATCGGFPMSSGPERLEIFAGMCRFGFEPTHSALYYDGYAPTGPANPRTGLPWTVDELYDEGNVGEGYDQGTVVDAVIAEMVDTSSGESMARAMPYRITPDDGLVLKEPRPYPFPTLWFIRAMTRPVESLVPPDAVDPLRDIVSFLESIPVRDVVKRTGRMIGVMNKFETDIGFATFNIVPRDSDDEFFRTKLADFYGRGE